MEPDTLQTYAKKMSPWHTLGWYTSSIPLPQLFFNVNYSFQYNLMPKIYIYATLYIFLIGVNGRSVYILVKCFNARTWCEPRQSL